MNLVIKHGDEFATTSEIIAQNTNTQHKNIIELVGTYKEQIEQFGPLAFETRKGKSLPQGGFAKATEVAILNEQQSTFLLTLMRNSEIVVRFKVELVKEFYRLRNQTPAIDPMVALNDPATMRGLLLGYTEKVLKLETTVAEQAPKVEAFDRIADADGTMNPTVAAKALQINPKKLFDYLREKMWIYRRPGGGGNVAYQDKIRAGLLTHKVTTVQREDGTDKVIEQVLVTGKGLAKLSQSFGMSPC